LGVRVRAIKRKEEEEGLKINKPVSIQTSKS